MTEDIQHIFRAYDIRGTEDELSAEVMEDIGRAYGTVLTRNEAERAVVGRDARNTSPILKEAFVRGLRLTGVDVLDMGLQPFGVVLFYGWKRDVEIAYVTASHMPKDWNGVKFYHPDGVGYVWEENREIRDIFLAGEFEEGESGDVEGIEDGREEYIEYVASHMDAERMKVVLDCGNGVAGLTAPDLFKRAGFDVETLFGEPDGDFPNRESDITEESMEDLRRRVGNSDLGIAYDGDSDRCALMTSGGRLLQADETAYIVLDGMLEERSGSIVANVECSRLMEDVAERHGVEVVRIRVGHTYMCNAVIEHDAVLGVEKAGHFVVPDVFTLDDGVASSAYFASVLSRSEESLEEKLERMPKYYRDRIAFKCRDEDKFNVVERLQDRFSGEYEDTNSIDGIRVDLPEGWVLVRASNTSPKIRLTVEAEDEDSFEELRERFSREIEQELEEVG